MRFLSFLGTAAALLALSLSSAPLAAAAPSLTLPNKVSGAPGAFLSVSATTTGKNVAWFVVDPGLNLFPVSLLKDTHTAVVTSGTPGTYRLLAITAAGDEISPPAVCSVVIEGAAPTPAPSPSPTPTPTPTPTPAPALTAKWAIVVLDNSTRTPAIGQLISSATLIQTLLARGVVYRVLDVTDPLVSAKNYGPAIAAAGGTPALLVFAANGTRIKAVRLPADEASFLAAIPLPAAVSALPASFLTPLSPSLLCPT